MAQLHKVAVRILYQVPGPRFYSADMYATIYLVNHIPHLVNTSPRTEKTVEIRD